MEDDRSRDEAAATKDRAAPGAFDPVRPSPAGASAGPVWTIEELTRGGREARIRHAGADYRLRITSNGRLILTK